MTSISMLQNNNVANPQELSKVTHEYTDRASNNSVHNYTKQGS